VTAENLENVWVWVKAILGKPSQIQIS